MEKLRSTFYFPEWMFLELKKASDISGKSMNSIVIDSCTEYLKKYREDHKFIYELVDSLGGKNER